MQSILSPYPIASATQEDAVTYIRCLKYLAESDGLHHSEATFIQDFIAQRDWPSNTWELASAAPLNSLESLNLTELHKTIFGPYLLRDLYLVAYVHDGVSEAEDAAIAAISEKLGISGETCQRIRQATEAQITAHKLWGQCVA